jgi:hypothetical protein
MLCSPQSPRPGDGSTTSGSAALPLSPRLPSGRRRANGTSACSPPCLPWCFRLKTNVRSLIAAASAPTNPPRSRQGPGTDRRHQARPHWLFRRDCRAGGAGRSPSAIEPSPPRRNGNWKMASRDRRPKPALQGPKYQKLPAREWGMPTLPTGMSAILPHLETTPRRPDWLAGAGGFEPPHGGIKIRCLTPRRFFNPCLCTLLEVFFLRRQSLPADRAPATESQVI